MQLQRPTHHLPALLRRLQLAKAQEAAERARTPPSASTSASSKFGRPRQGASSRPTPSSEPGPKDNVLSQIRAYSRLKPADRKALLTEQGARDRMRAHNITLRQSIAHLPFSGGGGARGARGAVAYVDCMWPGCQGADQSMQYSSWAHIDAEMALVVHTPPLPAGGLGAASPGSGSGSKLAGMAQAAAVRAAATEGSSDMLPPMTPPSASASPGPGSGRAGGGGVMDLGQFSRSALMRLSMPADVFAKAARQQLAGVPRIPEEGSTAG